MKSSVAGLLFSLCFAMVIGCGPKPGGPAPVPSPQAPAVQPTPPPAAGKPLALVAVDKQGYDAFLAQQKGKVVLVDFWATWCPPCVEFFPHTVAISKKFDARQLTVASFSFDDPTDPDAKQAAVAFLTKSGAAFDHLLSKLEMAKAVEVYDIPGGAIPVLKLYDRTGKLRHTFSQAEDEIKPELIELRIKELLAEPAP